MEPDGQGGGDGAFLARVTQGPRAALVRCTLSGRCELATPVRPIPHAGAGPVLPTTFGPMAAGNVAIGGNAGDAGAAGN
ncbi:hypothetical protein SAMN05421678_101550 [Actinopolymorpha cephalotaxi]|uniref:Uncharacterized protein n=1 Tax=Actinopolymorpha cephalotaxi TaxID=504797 RepID=A0A1I2KWA6_9ACTN|nr:hypothetical protein [Actinopolymorpha cephalotaxi]NYH84693.1 hypothetical protein [Actinopolymorpha cephalotaxi]SFF70853.1 hypothetical protein SAMN05421678_101550 [Actinopolymorpha cephalotaxi]